MGTSGQRRGLEICRNTAKKDNDFEKIKRGKRELSVDNDSKQYQKITKLKFTAHNEKSMQDNIKGTWIN